MFYTVSAKYAPHYTNHILQRKFSIYYFETTLKAHFIRTPSIISKPRNFYFRLIIIETQLNRVTIAQIIKNKHTLLNPYTILHNSHNTHIRHKLKQYTF